MLLVANNQILYLTMIRIILIYQLCFVPTSYNNGMYRLDSVNQNTSCSVRLDRENEVILCYLIASFIP